MDAVHSLLAGIAIFLSLVSGVALFLNNPNTTIREESPNLNKNHLFPTAWVVAGILIGFGGFWMDWMLWLGLILMELGCIFASYRFRSEN